MVRMKFHRRLAWLAPVALLAATVALARSEGQGKPARLQPRVVVLVRHAEKSTQGDARDPELSPAGVERAETLARTLAHAGATRLVASEYKRTQATLAPLAKRLGLALETRPAADVAALAAELLAAAPGSVTVVAGHSNTVPELAAALGVTLPDTTATPKGPQLGDAEYDRLFVLHLPPADAGVPPSVLELRYGS